MDIYSCYIQDSLNQLPTKCHDRSVAEAPVGVLYILCDEGQHMLYYIVLAARGHQHQTHTCCLARIPLIVIIKLLLQK